MQKAKALIFSLLLLVFSFGLSSEEKAPTQEKPQETVNTTHTIVMGGETVTYNASAGILTLKDEQNQNKEKANIFYVAYTKPGTPENLSKRPIAFCFNGGPGSSAIWLNIGFLGPKQIVLNEQGCAVPPYSLADNPLSLLSITDLVFIDPVSTGYSKALAGEDPKQFHSVQPDIEWMAEFIRLYTTHFDRWRSPKFIIGESYGTLRAAGVAEHLHTEHHLYVNGVVLISSLLNFQTIVRTHSDEGGNDLPYILSLPTYAATAWYHKMLHTDLQKKTLPALLKEVETYSIEHYSIALLKGNQLTQFEQEAVLHKLHDYTGIPKEYLKQVNMRMTPSRFCKELLRKNHHLVGRFDSRVVGVAADRGCGNTEFDPSLDGIAGGFKAAYIDYIRNDLQWKNDNNYNILGDVWPWNYSQSASNQYLNLSQKLVEVMTKNPNLNVFVASGYYDLATPYFATSYTFDHLKLDPSLRSHITLNYYECGHLIYTHQPSMVKLAEDLNAFIKKTCK